MKITTSKKTPIKANTDINSILSAVKRLSNEDLLDLYNAATYNPDASPSDGLTLK